MRKPLGYWLKYIDGQVERDFERLLGAWGLTRRHWQVMNALPATTAEIDGALSPFLTTATPTLQPLIDDLTARGWVTGGHELTDEGRRVHEQVAEQVRDQRRKVVDGLTQEEYDTLIGLLSRIAENLTPQ